MTDQPWCEWCEDFHAETDEELIARGCGSERAIAEARARAGIEARELTPEEFNARLAALVAAGHPAERSHVEDAAANIQRHREVRLAFERGRATRRPLWLAVFMLGFVAGAVVVGIGGCASRPVTVVDTATRDAEAVEWARELCELGPGERVARLDALKGQFRDGWLVVGCYSR